MFYRLETDGTRIDIPLEGTMAGLGINACWLIGGGPSLSEIDWRGISTSPIPRMGINLAGSGLFRPTFWTSYDPSARFHRSVYLDAGIMKFVHRRRAMDLIPETTFKVCECPNLYFFDRDRERGFGQFVASEHRGIVDWADSMVQGIDLLYHLGFRTIYLAGCDMRVRPTLRQMDLAQQRGIVWDEAGLLSEFIKRCDAAGLKFADQETEDPITPYHFDEVKSLRTAINTDAHYYRISQYLRLSRRGLALAGLNLISVTPNSRLNDYFPFKEVEAVLDDVKHGVGDPQQETTRGRYQLTSTRSQATRCRMKDFRPPNLTEPLKPACNQPIPTTSRHSSDPGELVVEAEGFEQSRKRIRTELKRALNTKVSPQETG